MGLALLAADELVITNAQPDTQETPISSVPEHIRKATNGFQQQVSQSAELLFSGFADSEASGLYPESLAPLSAERYDVVVSTIRPAFDLFAQKIGFEAAAQTDVSKDTSGFLGVLSKISAGERDFEHLKQVIITLPMVIPSRFDLGDTSPSIEGIAQIKMHASGYEICTWAAAHTMQSEGLFADSPRDIYEIMESSEYKQLNNLGAVITRIADDIGDLEENAELGIFNVMNGEHKEQLIEEFCRISDVDFKGIDMSSEDATLQSFVDIFKEKVAVQLSRDNLPASERQLLKIFMLTAVIVYVNRVGDEALTA